LYYSSWNKISITIIPLKEMKRLRKRFLGAEYSCIVSLTTCRLPPKGRALRSISLEADIAAYAKLQKTKITKEELLGKPVGTKKI
jgi:hypothetical protein